MRYTIPLLRIRERSKHGRHYQSIDGELWKCLWNASTAGVLCRRLPSPVSADCIAHESRKMIAILWSVQSITSGVVRPSASQVLSILPGKAWQTVNHTAFPRRRSSRKAVANCLILQGFANLAVRHTCTSSRASPATQRFRQANSQSLQRRVSASFAVLCLQDMESWRVA